MELLNHSESQYALYVAFITMKERYKQLHLRLTKIEKENSWLREHYEKNKTKKLVKLNPGFDATLNSQQGKIPNLRKQKSQLSYHIFMVSSENEQLWKSLSDLSQRNKNLGNQVIKVSDILRQYPSLEISTFLLYSFQELLGYLGDLNSDCILAINKGTEYSSVERSSSLTNSSEMHKSELEQQYQEIFELKSKSESNFNQLGFTCPEDFIGNDSLEQLKYHNVRLSQIKEALLVQQHKFENTLKNIKKMRNQTCKDCKNSIEQLMHRSKIQFCSKCISMRNEATQINETVVTLESNKKKICEEKICPLCGMIFKKSISFTLFHEHVINHFTKEIGKDFLTKRTI